MRRKKILVVLLCQLVLTTACIHKTGGAGITPWERVHTYNAALAEANHTLEQGAEAAVSSNLLVPAQAAPIIGWTGQVAILHQQVTAILAQGSATSANVASVKALVDQIKASLKVLPVAIGVKNPKSQQAFTQDVSNIGTLADSLLAALEAVGGGQ